MYFFKTNKMERRFNEFDGLTRIEFKISLSVQIRPIRSIRVLLHSYSYFNESTRPRRTSISFVFQSLSPPEADLRLQILFVFQRFDRIGACRLKRLIAHRQSSYNQRSQRG